MRTTLEKLESARATRPPGYVDALLAAGEVHGEELHISREALNAVRVKHGLEAEVPGLAQMARNAASALARGTLAAVEGKPLLAGDEVVRLRQSICAVCPQYRSSDQRCAQCGCRLASLIGKWQLATEKCPLGKW